LHHELPPHVDKRIPPPNVELHVCVTHLTPGAQSALLLQSSKPKIPPLEQTVVSGALLVVMHFCPEAQSAVSSHSIASPPSP